MGMVHRGASEPTGRLESPWRGEHFGDLMDRSVRNLLMGVGFLVVIGVGILALAPLVLSGSDESGGAKP